MNIYVHIFSPIEKIFLLHYIVKEMQHKIKHIKKNQNFKNIF